MAAEKLKVLRTLQEMRELEAYLADKDFIAFDTETTGVTKDSQVIGFSVAADVDEGFYVVLSEWVPKKKYRQDVCRICDGRGEHVYATDDEEGNIQAPSMLPCQECEGSGGIMAEYMDGDLRHLNTKAAAPAFLKCLQNKSLVMHNGVFDCSMVQNNFGVSLIESLHTDTMLLAHLLDENRQVGLKELGLSIFGEDANKEQLEMKASVAANGGVLTKDKYELYKADSELMGRYGAKDAVLTLKLFYHLVPDLIEQGLDSFFYEEESMPLLRGPTYELNTTGLTIDNGKLQLLKKQLEADCLEAKAFIYKEITPLVKAKYPGTGKTNHFNIGASAQLAWLLFLEMGNDFYNLTKEGRNLCRVLKLKVPYAPGAKREFLRILNDRKGEVYEEPKYNYKTKKMTKPKKIREAQYYLACGKDSLKRLAPKYKWVERYLEYAKNLKLLNTYVEGVESRVQYGVIRPSFLQHGTTSGRYASRNPNFQNLPRDDKRVKSFVVARPGKVFVGADHAQLEPRIFASISKCLTLLECFRSGQDFYSVVGAPVYDKTDCSLFKDDKDGFAKIYPKLRDYAKVFALATFYGRTAFQQASAMGIDTDEAERLIGKYFQEYPEIEAEMLISHEAVKRDGCVKSLYGRPRRIPAAKDIPTIYGNVPHSELPYAARTLLNLAVNHRVQSSAASIMNRGAILCWQTIQEFAKDDSRWYQVKIVLQVHDELVLEGPEELDQEMAEVLKYSMENAVELPGVALIADPKIAKSLAELK